MADANGLSSDRELRVGQTLNVPSRVTGGANNSNTFKPYNPGEVVGDTTPNLPSPPVGGGGGGGGCGGLGTILVIVVTVAVAIYAPQLLPNLGNAFLNAAAAAAVGNVAGQVVGNALGAQEGFSWKAVAMAAISGGVTQGMGGTNFTGGADASLGNTIARAAVSNAMTQGIAVVTGLQEKFSWTSVAASAVGAGVGHGMNQALGLTDAAGKATSNYQGYQGMDRIARAALSGFAAGTATTLARGGRVAVTQIATDAFGNALGNTFGGELAAQAEFDRISTQFDAMQAAARKGLAFRTDMNGNVSTLPARSLAKTGQPSGSFAEPDAQAAQQSMRDGAARIRGMQAYGQGVQLASAGAYAGMEVLSDSAPSPFNAEWAMMTGGDDRVDRTVVANQTPVAAKPGDRTDPLGRVVRIGDGQYTEREILQIARGLQVGDAAGTPFLDQARTILREHGFRTGVTGTEESMRAVTDVDRRVALIRGDSNTEIAQLQRSADVALETGGQELNERRAVFSGDGKVTRIMED
ncbi:MAG: hypothetical protein ACK5PE_00050, partial [bacterium]